MRVITPPWLYGDGLTKACEEIKDGIPEPLLSLLTSTSQRLMTDPYPIV